MTATSTNGVKPDTLLERVPSLEPGPENVPTGKTTLHGSHQTDSRIPMKNKVLAIMRCTLTIASWLGSAHLVKRLQSDDADSEQTAIDKPFFLMFCSVACSSLLSIPWLLMNRCRVDLSCLRLCKTLMPWIAQRIWRCCDSDNNHNIVHRCSNKLRTWQFFRMVSQQRRDVEFK